MLSKKMAPLGMLLFALFHTVWGHIDSLKIAGVAVATKNSSLAGGQTFAPNQKVAITWKVTIAHTEATTFLSHSTNGTTWIQDTTYPGPTNNLGLKTYSWTVPALNSNSVKFRVYQAHIPNSNPPMTVSDDYNLVSGVFSVQSNVKVMGKPHRNNAFSGVAAKEYSVNGARLLKRKSQSKGISTSHRPAFSKP